MQPEIHQYELPIHRIATPWWKKLVAFLAVACFTFAFRWIIESLLHWKHLAMVESLAMPLVVATALVFRPFSRTSEIWFPRKVSLIVAEDYVERCACMGRVTFLKRIFRGRIRLISESPRGLTVMDRGEFAARMLGFIFVPASTPAYTEIKPRLMQWLPPHAQG